jgi:recombinational DNA repair ATPase RecF
MMHRPYAHLRLQSVRALKRVELLNLGKINVLCGKNNTGKPTILEAAASNVTAGFGVTADENFIRELF